MRTVEAESSLEKTVSDRKEMSEQAPFISLRALVYIPASAISISPEQ